MGIVAIAVAACSHKTATETSASTEKTSSASVTYEQYMEGKKVYQQYCGKCHGLKSPGDYTAERWVKLIDKMAGRAKIDENQKEQIYRYVSVNAAI